MGGSPALQQHTQTLLQQPHSSGGEVVYTQHLLAALDEEIPVYDLVASGHGEDETPLAAKMANNAQSARK